MSAGGDTEGIDEESSLIDNGASLSGEEEGESEEEGGGNLSSVEDIDIG